MIPPRHQYEMASQIEQRAKRRATMIGRICEAREAGERMTQGGGNAGNNPPPFPADVRTRMSTFLRLIGNPTTLKLINAMGNLEYSVGVLATTIGVKQPLASKYLRRMEKKGLLERRRDGQRSLYRIKDPVVHDVFNRVRQHADPEPEA